MMTARKRKTKNARNKDRTRKTIAAARITTTAVISKGGLYSTVD